MKIEQQAQTRAFLIPIIRQRQGGNVHSTAVGATLMSRFKNAFGTPPAPNTAARGCAACFTMLTTYGRLNKISFTFTKKLSTGGDCCGFHFFQKAIHRKSLILCIK